MKKLLAIAMLLVAARVQAGEREWQPTLSGAFGVLQRGGQTALGFGGDGSLTYNFFDWLSIQGQVGCTHFGDVEERSRSDPMAGVAYSAIRCHLLPILQVSTTERLSPHWLRDFFVPSFGLGVGYSIEHRGQRKEIYQGIVSQALDDGWVLGPELAAVAGVDLRFAEQFAVGLRLRGTTPMGRDFGQSLEFGASVLATFLFY